MKSIALSTDASTGTCPPAESPFTLGSGAEQEEKKRAISRIPSKNFFI